MRAIAVRALRALRHEDGYAVLAGTSVRDAVKRNMATKLLGSRAHAHNALEDAQSRMFDRF